MSNINEESRPIPNPFTDKSISDDDLCSGCMHLAYRPGEMSSCSEHQKDRIVKKLIVGPWDSSRYGMLDNPSGPDFEVSVDDQLELNGQIYVNTIPDGGHVDDSLGIVIEIATHPKHGIPVQVVRVFRGETHVASFYANGIDHVDLEIHEPTMITSI